MADDPDDPPPDIRIEAQRNPTYHVRYSGGAGGNGSLVTDSFEEAVRAIVAAARSGCMVSAEMEEALKAAPKLDYWDHKLPKSIVSDYDLRCLPYAISSYLHHCAGIPACDAHHGGLCAMCGHAVRLVVQAAEPKILAAAIRRMAGALGARNIDLDPRTTDDTAA